jgi:hypothetical protein
LLALREKHELYCEIEDQQLSGDNIRVSNLDQLLFAVWAIMLLETSTSSHSTPQKAAKL